MMPAQVLGRDPLPGRDRVRVQVPEDMAHAVLAPGVPPRELAKAPADEVVLWSDYYARLCAEGALVALGFEGGPR